MWKEMYLARLVQEIKWTFLMPFRPSRTVKVEDVQREDFFFKYI